MPFLGLIWSDWDWVVWGSFRVHFSPLLSPLNSSNTLTRSHTHTFTRSHTHTFTHSHVHTLIHSQTFCFLSPYMSIIPSALPPSLPLEIASIIFSTLGVLLIFFAFIGLSHKRFHPKSEVYLFFNCVGSTFLFVSLLISSLTGSLGAVPICLLQIPWGFTAGFKLRKVRAERRRGGEGDANCKREGNGRRESLPDFNTAVHNNVSNV